MGLKKPYPVNHLGLDVEYWKIGRINIDSQAKVIEVTLYGWLRKEDRLAGKPYIAEKRIILDENEYSEIMDKFNIIEFFYNQIKNRRHEIEGLEVMDLTGSKDD